MGAFEHLKTLCCLGLKPESAMIAVTPLLHAIIPQGWTRMALLKPDATIASGYAEHPGAGAIYRERLWRFVDDPSSPMSLWIPSFRANGIGWSLHMQGRGWLDSAWYHEIEAPLDSCWILDAMVADGGRTIGFVHLGRPRNARPFTADDVQRLDRLRPWLAHAFRRNLLGDVGHESEEALETVGRPVLCGEMILTPNREMVFQTNGLEFLLKRVLAGEPGNYTHYLPIRDTLPTPVLKLLQRINGAANGSLSAPPRMQVSTSYGVVTLEAKWLVPKGATPTDVAKDPKSCLISVTIELREHAIAYAARMLRESGATPTQVKVGIQLALGKTKPVIADELGIKPSSVADQTKRLYQTLEIHNSAELSTRIWLAEARSESRRNPALSAGSKSSRSHIMANAAQA
jgi:DNA-binding CsgD family transcriptional regulator